MKPVKLLPYFRQLRNPLCHGISLLLGPVSLKDLVEPKEEFASFLKRLFSPSGLPKRLKDLIEDENQVVLEFLVKQVQRLFEGPVYLTFKELSQGDDVLCPRFATD